MFVINSFLSISIVKWSVSSLLPPGIRQRLVALVSNHLQHNGLDEGICHPVETLYYKLRFYMGRPLS